MAMGKRSKRARQEELWMATATMVETPGHAFYDRLNEVLVEHDFDRRIESGVKGSSQQYSDVSSLVL